MVISSSFIFYIFIILIFFLYFNNIYGESFQSRIGLSIDIPESPKPWVPEDNSTALLITSPREHKFDLLLETFDIVKFPSDGLTAGYYRDFLANIYLSNILSQFEIKSKDTATVDNIRSPFLIYKYFDENFKTQLITYEIIVPFRGYLYDIVMTAPEETYFKYLENYFIPMVKSIQFNNSLNSIS